MDRSDCPLLENLKAVDGSDCPLEKAMDENDFLPWRESCGWEQLSTREGCGWE